jgi:hypothetical protein
MYYTDKHVYKGPALKGTWKCALYIEVKIICTILLWENEAVLYEKWFIYIEVPLKAGFTVYW